MKMSWARTIIVGGLVMMCSDSARGGASCVAGIGFGTEESAVITGRWLEEAPNKIHGGSLLSKLYRNLDNYETDEIPDAPITIDVFGRRLETRTDEEGWFRIEIEATSDAWFAPGIHEATIFLEIEDTGIQVQAKIPILIYGRAQKTGILTDFDDTLVISDVPRKMALIVSTMTTDPEDLVPVPGMSDLFGRILGQRPNLAPPVFTVSGSPGNLYPRIQRFLEKHEFPGGPLFLKDLGLATFVPNALLTRLPEGTFTPADGLTDSVAFKLRVLSSILTRFKWMQFYCFGDSGEDDAAIYEQLAHDPRFENQIRGIFIRRVPGVETPATGEGPAEAGSTESALPEGVLPAKPPTAVDSSVSLKAVYFERVEELDISP